MDRKDSRRTTGTITVNDGYLSYKDAGIPSSIVTKTIRNNVQINTAVMLGAKINNNSIRRMA